MECQGQLREGKTSSSVVVVEGLKIFGIPEPPAPAGAGKLFHPLH